jgi:hypothetical protein
MDTLASLVRDTQGSASNPVSRTEKLPFGTILPPVSARFSRDNNSRAGHFGRVRPITQLVPWSVGMVCLAQVSHSALNSPAEAAPQKPINLLFLMTDQQRWDALSCAGNPVLKTPNLESVETHPLFATSPRL